MSLKMFKIVSGRLVVSDPCYDINDIKDGLQYQEKCHKGVWVCKVNKDNAGIICNLLCFHVDHKYNLSWTKTCTVGVDSGQIGVFDKKYYQSKESVTGVKYESHHSPIDTTKRWYSVCSDKTLSDDRFGVIPFGAISNSGYGDGGYELKVSFSKDLLVNGAYITFVTEEN